MNRTLVLTLSLILLGMTPALAQTTTAPPAKQLGVTMITLNVTEQQKVKQDVLIASIRYETRGKTAESVQDEINAKMSKALDVVKKEKSVRVSTEAYSVYMNQQVEQQTDPKTGKVTTTRDEQWTGSQSMTLESADAAAVQKLTGTLQGMGLAVNNLSYTLSPEQTETVRQTLMKGAVAKLKTQAAQAAELLGKKHYNIAEIAVDGSNMPQPPMPMMRAMAMDASGGAMEKSMSAPHAEPGESTVSMTLTARVELKD